MRNKILLIAASLLLAGCSTKSSNQKRAEEKALEAYIGTIDSTTSVLANAQTSDEFFRITKEFSIKAKDFAEKHKQAEVSKELLERVTEAGSKYQQTAEKKIEEISAKESQEYPSDSIPERENQ